MRRGTASISRTNSGTTWPPLVSRSCPAWPSAIDGAAHAGAIAAGTTAPIGVVGSGIDVIYPRRNASLWREVERRGVLLGEAPLGAAPERWRFPARNRMIAAIADVVIVVEVA